MSHGRDLPTPRGKGAGIAVAGEADLEDLLVLMRSYCDFYETAPSEADLLALSRRLIADPELEGVQLIARDAVGAVGFASVFWSWDTTEAARIGVMNDLYVIESARGSGVAARLVDACLERCAVRGARRLDWLTGPGNVRAQTLYERLGAVREEWVNYAMRPPAA